MRPEEEITMASLTSEDEDDAPPLAVPIVRGDAQKNIKPAHNNSAAAAAAAASEKINTSDGGGGTSTTKNTNSSSPIEDEPTTKITLNSVIGETVVVPVPVLLLTGYLGAGKTTLVNYILSAKHGYRCAVLLNEIADSADIEKALVREPEGGQEAAPLADWVQLENGCICCSVKNDMVQALEGLLRQRDKFDYVIIETTGLANPGPVAAALWTDAQLESSICLDAIVTVVDAKNISRHFFEVLENGAVNDAQQQVAFADIVLLNKIDLVGDAKVLEEVETALRAVNAEAAIVRCERCEIDLGRILHTGMYSGVGIVVEDEVEEEEEEEEEEEIEKNGHEHNHRHSCEHGDGGDAAAGCSHRSHAHSHDPAIRTVTLHVHKPLILQKLRHWLDELLWEGEPTIKIKSENTAADIFRVKGLLHVAGSPFKWVLQAVHELYDVTQGPEWANGSSSSSGAPLDTTKSTTDSVLKEQKSRSSKIVFIGRHLDGEKLQEGLGKCCVE